MSLSFNKIMNKVIVFLFLSNNVTNNIFGNKICSGKKSNGYSGKNKNEYKKLDTQDTSTTEQKAEDKIKESEESELKEKQKQKELEEQKQKELEEQREKEFEEQTKLGNSKQDFTNRFNKINIEIVNLINHKKNKFEINKEKILEVTLEEINALKIEEIDNFEEKIKKSENNFNNLITDLVNKLKTKFDKLKGEKFDKIKLDIEENIFLNLKESLKIIEIDNKLTNFEKAITDDKEGILKGIEPLYKELFSKLDKISKFDKIKNAFDFNVNTLDLIRTKEIAELVEIKTKLDNLNSKYKGIINERSNESKTKYLNLYTIITNYNGIFTDSTFVISEINKDEFKFENYEENYKTIDKNITDIETSLNNEFNKKLVALNKERSEKNKKLEGLGQLKIDEFNFKENENLNSKFTNLKNFKNILNTKDELIKNQIKNKKDDCTAKLNAIKKDEDGYDISDDILNIFIGKFEEISENIKSLESNVDYNNIINAIKDLKKEILEKIEEKRQEEEKGKEEEKKKKEIEDFINKYKTEKITNYNDFEEAFSSVKNIYDNINEENEDINKILENLIEKQDLIINKLFTENFDKLEFLGKGCFGTVRKYIINKEGDKNIKVFALKEINFDKIYKFEEKKGNKDKVKIRKKYLNLFEKEIKYLLLFKGYNNISQITDVYKMNSSYLYSTKYYKNGDLKKNLGKLSEKDIINIMYELIIALRNIHKNGVVHCDIKPGNILLDENNKAYIGDFGFSQFGDNLKLEVGDRNYMPVEKVQKNFSRRKSDLYALLLCFVSLIEKKNIQYITSDNCKELYVCIDKNNKNIYNNYNNLKNISGFYELFDKVFIKRQYEQILKWDNFLQTDFWKNLESKYKKQNNIK